MKKGECDSCGEIGPIVPIDDIDILEVIDCEEDEVVLIHTNMDEILCNNCYADVYGDPLFKRTE